MKPSRLVLIAGPFLCILLFIWFLQTLERPEGHARSSGEHLAISALAPDEEVVVAKVFSHRRTIAREYRIGGPGGPRSFAAFSLSAKWENGVLSTEPKAVLAVRMLTDAEAAGLDETIAYFRDVREQISSATRNDYRLTYFRSGEKIGEEFFIGFSLTGDLTYFAREGYRGDPNYEADYVELAERAGVSRSQLDRMITFEMLEQSEFNHGSHSSPAGVLRESEGSSAN